MVKSFFIFFIDVYIFPVWLIATEIEIELDEFVMKRLYEKQCSEIDQI